MDSILHNLHWSHLVKEHQHVSDDEEKTHKNGRIYRRVLKFYFCVAKTLCIIQRAKFLGSGFCKKVRFEEKNEENCEK